MVYLSNFGLISTFFLAVGALWVALSRFSMRLDSNWPLVFYTCLVLWANTYESTLHPYLVYASVVCGLLLRFEFLNERLVLVIRFVELGALILVAWGLFQLLLQSV